eukprot:894074-Pelagomonas_calceolata.AAC.2
MMVGLVTTNEPRQLLGLSARASPEAIPINVTVGDAELQLSTTTYKHCGLMPASSQIGSRCNCCSHPCRRVVPPISLLVLHRDTWDRSISLLLQLYFNMSRLAICVAVLLLTPGHDVAAKASNI